MICAEESHCDERDGSYTPLAEDVADHDTGGWVCLTVIYGANCLYLIRHCDVVPCVGRAAHLSTSLFQVMAAWTMWTPLPATTDVISWSTINLRVSKNWLRSLSAMSQSSSVVRRYTGSSGGCGSARLYLRGTLPAAESELVLLQYHLESCRCIRFGDSVVVLSRIPYALASQDEDAEHKIIHLSSLQDYVDGFSEDSNTLPVDENTNAPWYLFSAQFSRENPELRPCFIEFIMLHDFVLSC